MATNTHANSGASAATQPVVRPGKPGSDRVVALNFRVSTNFKKAFKIAAATQGITQSDLLQQVFDEWQQRHG